MSFYDQFWCPKIKIEYWSGNEDDQHEGWEGDPLHGGVGHHEACIEQIFFFVQKLDLNQAIKITK